MGLENSKEERSDIVVVNQDPSKAAEKQGSTVSKRLSKFQPLLQHSASYGILPGDHSALKQLNPRHIVELFTLYEEHLRQSAAVVTEEQNTLTRDIKQTDVTVSQILAVTQKKQSVYSVWSSNIQTSVKEINSHLSAMQKTVDGLIPLVNELNEMLPVDERMAPFTEQGQHS